MSKGSYCPTAVCTSNTGIIVNNTDGNECVMGEVEGVSNTGMNYPERRWMLVRVVTGDSGLS